MPVSAASHCDPPKDKELPTQFRERRRGGWVEGWGGVGSCRSGVGRLGSVG